MRDYIFFDLDGTLTDSQPGIYDGLKVVFDHYNISKTEEEMKLFLGPALWDSLPKYCGFNHEQCIKAVELYRDYYSSQGIYNNKVYDGVIDMLKTLKENGKHLMLATGKPEEQANIVMNHFNLTPYFEFIGGSTMDKSRSKKSQVINYVIQKCGLQELDKKRIIMVGDRNNDIEGAHQNGIEVVAVLYGYGNRKEFEDAGADYIVNTVSELKDFILKGTSKN